MPRFICQINPTTLPSFFPPAGKITSISSVLNLILPIATIGAALIFLLMSLYASFTWLTAGGEAKNVEKAQKILTFSVLGFIIVVVSFFAVKLIGVILGINLPL